MHRALKHFFIPHHGNSYHPHILHSKRAVFYSLVFLLVKMITVTFIILIPQEAFLFPDVLAEQYQTIIKQTNAVRAKNGLPALRFSSKLDTSSQAKADDMADYQYFSHIGPNKRSLSYFLNKAHYEYVVAGENLAMGFSDAESVVQAWQKSPTHNANLIDKDFAEIGVGLQAGYYHGAPTVFVAQHFGAPWTAVEGSKILPREIPVSVEADSLAYWLETPEGTELQIRARINGSVSAASALVGKYKLPLSLAGDSVYTGKLVVPDDSDSFFQPVVLPTVSVTDTAGQTYAVKIDWFAPKIVEPTPMEKYIQGKESLRSITPLFALTNIVIVAFFIFFAGVLFTYVVLQARMHNYRVIGQTVAMIVLLAVLRFV